MLHCSKFRKRDNWRNFSVAQLFEPLEIVYHLQITTLFSKDWWYSVQLQSRCFLSLFNLHSNDVFCALWITLKCFAWKRPFYWSEIIFFGVTFTFTFTLWDEKIWDEKIRVGNQWILTYAANDLEKHCVFSNVYYCNQLLMKK